MDIQKVNYGTINQIMDSQTIQIWISKRLFGIAIFSFQLSIIWFLNILKLNFKWYIIKYSDLFMDT